MIGTALIALGIIISGVVAFGLWALVSINRINQREWDE